MANTPEIDLKLPSTADNIAEQINIDTVNNLTKIDNAIKNDRQQINNLDAEIGDIAILTTTDKTNVVSAINEVNNNKLDKTKQGWKALSPQNGWTGTLYYRKNQIEQLEIQGTLTAGTLTAGTTIATMPEGYRPSRYSPIEFYVASLSKVVNGLVLANDTGVLRIQAPATTELSAGNIISICKVLP